MKLTHTLTDGDVSVRSFDVADTAALIAGRDNESRRFLGEGSPDPRPLGVIVVEGQIVGWVDADDERDWLAPDQVNVGYSVHPEARGNRVGTWALVLLCGHLAALDPPLRPTLLIDPQNAPSLALAGHAGFVETRRIDGEPFFELVEQAG